MSSTKDKTGFPLEPDVLKIYCERRVLGKRREGISVYLCSFSGNVFTQRYACGTGVCVISVLPQVVALQIPSVHNVSLVSSCLICV